MTAERLAEIRESAIGLGQQLDKAGYGGAEIVRDLLAEIDRLTAQRARLLEAAKEMREIITCIDYADSADPDLGPTNDDMNKWDAAMAETAQQEATDA